MEKYTLNQKEEKISVSNFEKVWHAVNQVDSHLFSGDRVKEAVKKAIHSQKLGLFALDCIVSYPKAHSNQVGKAPAQSFDEFVQNSLILYHQEPLAYLLDEFHKTNIAVELSIFLGDDDYQYSVDQPWKISNPAVYGAIASQKSWLAQELSKLMDVGKGDKLHVLGWTDVEQIFPETLIQREAIVQQIQAEKSKPLPARALNKPLERQEAFISWRQNVAGKTVEPEHIKELAMQELVSFVTQGHCAPAVIKKLSGDIPLVFVNTFPGYHVLDDACVRLAGKLGMQGGMDYGTIHLPDPNNFTVSGYVEKSKSKGSRTVMTCGDPKGNPNWL